MLVRTRCQGQEQRPVVTGRKRVTPTGGVFHPGVTCGPLAAILPVMVRRLWVGSLLLLGVTLASGTEWVRADDIPPQDFAIPAGDDGWAVTLTSGPQIGDSMNSVVPEPLTQDGAMPREEERILRERQAATADSERNEE